MLDIGASNVEVVRRFYGTLASNANAYWTQPRSYAAELEKGESDPGAREGLDLLHPEIRWQDALGHVREGKLAFARGADELLQALGAYSLTLDEVTDLGDDYVLAVVRVDMTGLSSGLAGAMSVFCLATVRVGLIAEIVEYSNRADALTVVIRE